MSFFTSQTTILQQIVNEFKEQILDHLVLINFGSLDYEITKVSINTDELIPETPSQENKTVETSEGKQVDPAMRPELQKGNGQSPQFGKQSRMSVSEDVVSETLQGNKSWVKLVIAL